MKNLPRLLVNPSSEWHIKVLIIDCNNIAWRENFARPNLSHNGQATGMIYGFLQQMTLSRTFDMSLCLCWDSDQSLRKEFHPEYKSNRPPKDPAHLAQLNALRLEIMPRIGWHCHHLDGYEADDLIAVISRRPGRHIIVSSDSDLYQLLNDDVSIYDPGKRINITMESFSEQYGVGPGQWAMAKAIAGDTSDNVVGVPRVGIKTAIKYIRSEVITTKLWQKIDDHAGVIARNLKLVALPWEGCESKLGPTPVSKFNAGEFEAVCREYGLYSLLG